MDEDLPPPIPAATLVLMRPATEAAPELLMMERSASMAFAAGALVFPGGRIEAQDVAFAARFPQAHAAARIAAIRETIEETGIAAALPPAQPETIARIREALIAGGNFADLLGAHGLALDLDALTPFARWRPNFRETRRFDTFFFIAEAPADDEVQADAVEAVRAFWASARGVLQDVEQGRAHAIFPTRRNLERLAFFASFDEARASALAHEVTTITPWIEEREGEPHLCIPEGLGYPVTSEPLATARRS